MEPHNTSSEGEDAFVQYLDGHSLSEVYDLLVQSVATAEQLNDPVGAFLKALEHAQLRNIGFFNRRAVDGNRSLMGKRCCVCTDLSPDGSTSMAQRAAWTVKTIKTLSPMNCRALLLPVGDAVAPSPPTGESAEEGTPAGPLEMLQGALLKERYVLKVLGSLEELAGLDLSNIPPNQVLLLPAVARGTPATPSERVALARSLMTFGEVYVCDALSNLHLDDVVTSDLPRIMGEVLLGSLAAMEVKHLSPAVSGRADGGKRVLVLGDATATEAAVLTLGANPHNLLNLFDVVQLVSRSAEAASPVPIYQLHTTDTPITPEEKQAAAALLAAAKELGVPVHYPVDVTVSRVLPSGRRKYKVLDASAAASLNKYTPIDFGPRTAETFGALVAVAGTVLVVGGVSDPDVLREGDGAPEHGLGAVLARVPPQCHSVVAGDRGLACLHAVGPSLGGSASMGASSATLPTVKHETLVGIKNLGTMLSGRPLPALSAMPHPSVKKGAFVL